MGLDMYLYAKKNICFFSSKEDAAKIAEAFPELAEAGISEPSSGSITIEVAYWRKANAIHNWFVRNVQANEDDCGAYSVSRQQLETLVGLAEQIIADRSLAEKLLPTQSGFFFGETIYDEWYIRQLENTIVNLNKVLALSEEWTFNYQSSW